MLLESFDEAVEEKKLSRLLTIDPRSRFCGAGAEKNIINLRLKKYGNKNTRQRFTVVSLYGQIDRVSPRNDKHKRSSYFLQLTGAENRQTYQILGPNIQRNVKQLIRENDPLDSKFASHRSRKISKQTDHV